VCLAARRSLQAMVSAFCLRLPVHGAMAGIMSRHVLIMNQTLEEMCVKGSGGGALLGVRCWCGSGQSRGQAATR